MYLDLEEAFRTATEAVMSAVRHDQDEQRLFLVLFAGAQESIQQAYTACMKQLPIVDGIAAAAALRTAAEAAYKQAVATADKTREEAQQRERDDFMSSDEGPEARRASGRRSAQIQCDHADALTQAERDRDHCLAQADLALTGGEAASLRIEAKARRDALTDMLHLCYSMPPRR